jgi:hypothetical protein
VVALLGRAAHVYRRLGKRAGPFGGRDDDGRAPSVTRQQSYLRSGEAISGEDSTSSTVRGLSARALGFLIAHSRAETATAASCSLVVPNPGTLLGHEGTIPE